MADKQIKDFANTPLADTDSLVKQSVMGLTASTTLADIKGNLDGRYAEKGKVVWENENGDDYTSPLNLKEGKKYEIYTNSRCVIDGQGEKVLLGRQSKTILVTNFEELYPVLVYVVDNIEGTAEFETAVFHAGVFSAVYADSPELKIYKIVESEV